MKNEKNLIRTICFIFGIIINLIFFYSEIGYYVSTFHQPKIATIVSLGIIGITNVLFIVFIFRLKILGLFGLIGTTILEILIINFASFPIVLTIVKIILILLLYAMLNIKINGKSTLNILKGNQKTIIKADISLYERHGFLKFYFVLGIIYGIISILIMLMIAFGIIDDRSMEEIYLLLFYGILMFIPYILLLKWKMLGFILYCIFSGLLGFLAIIAASRQEASVIDVISFIISPVILYFLLKLKKNNVPAWDYLKGKKIEINQTVSNENLEMHAKELPKLNINTSETIKKCKRCGEKVEENIFKCPKCNGETFI